MALSDLARQSAIASPNRESNLAKGPIKDQEFPSVLLQLELPSLRPELVDGFACQLAIQRSVWEDSVIGKALKTGSDEFCGQAFFEDRKVAGLRLVMLRNLMVLGYGYRIVQAHAHMAIVLNSVLRVTHVERDAHKNVWLVRATMESGGLLFEKPTFYHGPRTPRKLKQGVDFDRDQQQDIETSSTLQDRIWPNSENERLAGIFFTGSELQIEIGRPKLTRTQGIRRYRLLGVVRGESGSIEQAVWEQVASNTVLSRTNITDVFPDHPTAALTEKFEELEAICKELRIGLAGAPDSSGSRIVVHVQKMNSEKDRKKDVLMRIDWALTFNRSTGFASTVQWQPRTLLSKLAEDDDKNVIELLDTDEVDRLLQTGSRGAADGKAGVTFTWTKTSDELDMKVPETRLAGTSTRDGAAPHAAPRDLWFLARCSKAGSPYPDLPAVWMNISADEPPATPVGDDPRAARLSGPLTFEQSVAGPGIRRGNDATSWRGAVLPATSATISGEPEAHLKLALSAKSGGAFEAVLSVFEPNMILDSPEIDFYNVALNDPRSVPNERRPHESRVLQRGSLRFIYRSEWATEHPTQADASEDGDPDRPQPSVRCAYDTDDHPDRFVVRRTPAAATIYLPADRALVDPVSVTRGNLVAQQTVAIPVLMIPPEGAEGARVQVLDIRPGNPELEEPTPSQIDVALTEEIVLHGFVPNPNREKEDKSHPMKDFFVELISDDEERISTVARFQDATQPSNKPALMLTLQVSAAADLSRLVKNARYFLCVGPTRLALPRDVNHGLTAIRLNTFWFDDLDGHAPILNFAADHVRGIENQSVLALHPWSEWGPDPANWIKTGRIRLHHRNLIQEHAEFESSFEDRFPPEGPAKDQETGAVPSPLLPLSDFLRAVRDRYTAATGNLLVGKGEVRNWLPGSKFVNLSGGKPAVTVDLEEELPETKLSPIKTDEDKVLFAEQSLKLRDADEENADKHWLDVNVGVEQVHVGEPSELRLTPTDKTQVTSRRAVDSSVPLLFSPHHISALAWSAVPEKDRVVAIHGGPAGTASVSLFAASGQLLKTVPLAAAAPLDVALADVALVRHDDGAGAVYRGAAISKEGNLIRFVIKVEDDSVSLIDAKTKIVTLPADTVPRSLAAGPPGAASLIALLLARKSNGEGVVASLNPKNGAIDEIEVIDAKTATAAALDRHETQWTMAIGFSNGNVQLLTKKDGAAWKSFATLKRPTETSPVLNPSAPARDGEGQANTKLTKDAAVRSVAIGIDKGHWCVLACDGSPNVSAWGFHEKIAAESDGAIWVQPSAALTVAAGYVRDFEDRPESAQARAACLFASGLRNGEIHVAAAIADSDKVDLHPVRRFDAALAPVTHVSLPTLAPGERQPNGGTNSVAPVFIGTSAGIVRSWELRHGIEWPRSERDTQTIERVAPATFLDAVGVVRQLPAAFDGAARLLVESLSSLDKDGPETYASVSAAGVRLAGEPTDADDEAAEAVTDIRMWADSYKVRADGSVDPLHFADGEFEPGRIAFYSEITSAEEVKNLQPFDFFPRLDGIPFFVTGVRQLKVEGDPAAITEVVLEGVLINPDEVAAGQDRADRNTMPGAVARALSRHSVIVVSLTPNDPDNWSILGTESRIDWTFSVNRQLPDRDPQDGFPGGITRVISKPGSLRRDKESKRIGFAIEAHDSRALVFGRQWALEKVLEKGVDGLLLGSQASFKRKDKDSPWTQLGYQFSTLNDRVTDEEAGDIVERLSRREIWHPAEASIAGHLQRIDAQSTSISWDTQHDPAGRYLTFAKGTEVFVADRTTGLAFASDLFTNPQDKDVASTALVEHLEQDRNDMAARTNLTIGVGRVTDEDADAGEVQFAHLTGADVQAAASVAPIIWNAKSLQGVPRVELCHAPDRRGSVETTGSMAAGLARLTLQQDKTVPVAGEEIELHFPKKTKELLAGFAFAVRPHSQQEQASFGVARGIEHDGTGFLQMSQRIETSEKVGETAKFRCHVSGIGVPFDVGDRVRIVGTAGPTEQFGRVALVGENVDPIEIEGLTNQPQPGDRIHRLMKISEIEPPTEDRPTIRVKTDAKILDRRKDRPILLHAAGAATGLLAIADEIQDEGFDLYMPGEIDDPPDPLGNYAWRTVHPILDVAIGDVEAAVGLGPPAPQEFERIRITGIQEPSLDQTWTAVPNPDDAERVFLGKPRLGDGVAQTDLGAWTHAGDPEVPITKIDNIAGEPLVLTSAGKHELPDGTLVEVAGIAPSAGLNGPVRVSVEVVSVGGADETRFTLYEIARAPSAAERGDWELVDKDHAIEAIDTKVAPPVLEADDVPEAHSRFRLVIQGGPQEQVYIAGSVTSKAWQAWLPLGELADDSCWAMLFEIAPRPGDPRSIVRLVGGNFRVDDSSAVLAYDALGKLRKEPPLRAFAVESKVVCLTQEVTDAAVLKEVTHWTATPALSVVQMASSVGEPAKHWTRRLQYDKVPKQDAPPSGVLHGSTKKHREDLEFFRTAYCGQHAVAVATAGKNVLLWRLHPIREDAQPSARLTVKDPIQAIAVCQRGGDLLIALAHGRELSVHRLDHPLGDFVKVVEPWEIPGESDPTNVTLALTVHNRQFVLTAGLSYKDTDAPGVLSSWRLPIFVKGEPVVGDPLPIWPQTNLKHRIAALAAGAVAGSPQFFIRFEGDGVEHAPDIWAPDRMLLIRSDSDSAFSPQASLSVEMGTPPVTDGRIRARLAPTRTVSFRVETGTEEAGAVAVWPAYSRLRQGVNRCLTLKPTTPDAARGENGVILWPSGDLTLEAERPVTLSAASIQLISDLTSPPEVKLTIGGVDLSVKTTVQQVLLGVDVGSGSGQKLTRASLTGTLVIGATLFQQQLTLLLDGDVTRTTEEEVEITGILLVEKPAATKRDTDAPLLQSLIRCDVKRSEGQIEVAIKDDVFWTTVAGELLAPPASVPDIALPTTGLEDRTSFQVVTYGSEKVPQELAGFEFVRLGIKKRSGKHSLVLRAVAADEVPLLPELEPLLLRNPERHGEAVARLIHRWRGGLALRPDAPTGRYTPMEVSASTLKPSELSDERLLLLESVVRLSNGPALRIRPEGWLKRTQIERELKPQTDGLCVLNVDTPQNDATGETVRVVTALESRTQIEGETIGGQSFDRLRYRQILRDEKSQGIALQFSVADNRPADLTFIDSPFFDQVGRAADAAGDAGLIAALRDLTLTAEEGAEAPAALALDAAAETVSSMLGPLGRRYAGDPRILLPSNLFAEEDTAAPGDATPRSLALRTFGPRYLVDDLPADPYADACCLAHRQYRLLRKTVGGKPEDFEGSTPVLHVSDVPAFRQPARLAYSSARPWLRTEASREECFFPRRFDWELAADKPGAMFQILLQARVGGPHNLEIREPLIDFALREPQFIRLKDCVTAAVKWQKETQVDGPDGRADLLLVWTEVLGTAAIEDLADKRWLLPTPGGGIALPKPPLQLVIEFNSEVISVLPADAAVPAYRVKPQPEEATTAGTADREKMTPFYLPARTFLVGGTTFEELTKPQRIVTGDAVAGKVQKEGEILTLQAAEDSFKSGERCELTFDVDSHKELNGTVHRVLPQDGSFLLMQETVNERFEDDPPPKEVTLKVDGDAGPVEVKMNIISHRPICLQLVGDVTFANGAKLAEMPPAELTPLGIADGKAPGGPGDLKLCEIGDKHYLLLMPSPLAGPLGEADATVHKPHTRAVGYLEANLRHQGKTIKARRITDKRTIWKPNLVLDPIVGLDTPAYVRVFAPGNPAVQGIFRAWKRKDEEVFELALPSVRISAAQGNGGMATSLVEGETDQKSEIDSVNGSAPIEITLKGDQPQGWEHGTPIVVAGVQGAPEVNGTWIVEKIDSDGTKFHLFEPLVDGRHPAAEDKFEAIVSKVEMLSDSFREIDGQDQLAEMTYAPVWKEGDRPVLQVYWSGSADVPRRTDVPWGRVAVLAPLYEMEKQITFLANSQLAPKLVFVLSARAKDAPDKAVLQRTVLFGDAAPTFRAVAELREEGEPKRQKLILKVPDNRESLSVQLPDLDVEDFHLYLVKSMPSGVLVYNEMLTTKKP